METAVKSIFVFPVSVIAEDDRPGGGPTEGLDSAESGLFSDMFLVPSYFSFSRRPLVRMRY